VEGESRRLIAIGLKLDVRGMALESGFEFGCAFVGVGVGPGVEGMERGDMSRVVVVVVEVRAKPRCSGIGMSFAYSRSVHFLHGKLRAISGDLPHIHPPRVQELGTSTLETPQHVCKRVVEFDSLFCIIANLSPFPVGLVHIL